MGSSNETIDVFIQCGKKTARTRFNNQTDIKQVRECIHNSFPSKLLNSYRIQYYDIMTMSFVDLEQQLQNGSNPFGVQDFTTATSGIQLFIVNDSSFDIHSQTDLQDNQVVFNNTDENMLNDETHSESNSSIHSFRMNDDISMDDSQYLSEMNGNPLSQEISYSIGSQEQNNISSKRLLFSLDVKPNQKDIYKSDQFNIRAEKSNGRIARVQGIKTEEQKMLQVLPRLRIPTAYLESNATLAVAVVSEQIENGMRIWYKHPDKGFLPEGYDKNTEVINPIIFDLNKSNVTADNDFILKLHMLTKWDKSQKLREELYRYDDQKTNLVHPAIHSRYSPRLLCVIRRNGKEDWETFCLSDFIKSSKSPRLRSSNVSLERPSSSKRKSSKFNNITQT